MQHIRYSIIIPHYNTPKLLLRCLESIPEQNDIQVIVVDDNSPNANNYSQLYPQIFRKNVQVIFTKEDKGAGYARNEGLKHVTGKWVLFADADDFFTDNFTNLLDDYFDSDADIVFFNINSVMSDDITKTADRNIAKNKLFNDYLNSGDITPFRYSYYEPWGKMIKLKLIKKNNIQFDVTKVSNDYYFSVVCGCLAEKIVAVNKILYTVTLREGSLCFKYGDTLEKLLIRLEVATRVQIFCDKHGFKITPMPTRGLMVLLLKKSPIQFIKQLITLKQKGIPISNLLYQIFNPFFMSFKGSNKK